MNTQWILAQAPIEAFLAWNGTGSLYGHLLNWQYTWHRQAGVRKWENYPLMMPPDIDEYKGKRLAFGTKGTA